MTKTIQNHIARQRCKHKEVLCHMREFEVCGRDKCYVLKEKEKTQKEEPVEE